MKVIKNLKKSILFTLSIGLSIFILFFVITCTWIGFDVKTKCFEAKKEYVGSCVESLINLLEDESRGFQSRNSTIWALGQLGDLSALPVLEKFYTGNIPDKEPLNKTISQYELKKAINLVNGGKNLTAVFWRYNLN